MKESLTTAGRAMLRWLRAALGIGGIVLSAHTAMSQESRPETVSGPGAGVLAAILDWLVSEVGLPWVATLPIVRFVPSGQLAKMRLAHVPPEQRPGGPGSIPAVAAFYSDASGTIYLPVGWTGEGPKEMSVLVHEMVHHVQNIAALPYACPEAREGPAFAAQEAWLAASGADLKSAFQIDAMTLLLRTSCYY